MDISIIGSGNMARGIGTRLISGGHHVIFYSRDVGESMNLARELNNQSGLSVEGKPYSDPIVGEVAILAVPFGAVHNVVNDHYEHLANKIIVDITNPINLDTFTLIPPVGLSGAEQIASLLPPQTPLIKAFNTTFASTLLQGSVNNMPLDVFVAGEETDAKSSVMKLISDGGLRPLDVGALSQSRALEEMQLLHIKLQQQLGTNWMSTIKIVS